LARRKSILQIKESLNYVERLLVFDLEQRWVRCDEGRAEMKVVSLAALGVLLVGGMATSAAAQTKWDMPTPYPDGNFHTKNVAQFATDVAKATNNSLTITVHSAGSLFKHPEIKRAVRQGTAPIGEVLESLASNEAPVYGVDSVPFLTTGYDTSKKLYEAQKPFLEKQLASEGLMLLYSVPWPPQGIYGKREIKSVDDLKGLKFRTYNAMIGRIASLVGAIPTQIEVPDLPTAFATGRVDVMITSASTGVDTKAQDYLTHYIDTQAWQPRNIVFVNKQAFDGLSALQQKAVLDASKTAEARGWQLSLEEMKIKTEALKAAGIIVLPPTAELKAGFAKVGDTIASEWEKSAGPDGAALLATYRK
jgi:TRAP-type C4-dicarboxylate transport system substrate-binding protein